MSRWLKSVNNLLEQLDDQVGEVIEEGVDLHRGGPTSSSVDDILAKRGLGNEAAGNGDGYANDDTDDEFQEEEEEDDDDADEDEDDYADSTDQEEILEETRSRAAVSSTSDVLVSDDLQNDKSDELALTLQQQSEESSSDKTSEPEYEKVDFPSDVESPSSSPALTEVVPENILQSDAPADNEDTIDSNPTDDDVKEQDNDVVENIADDAAENTTVYISENTADNSAEEPVEPPSGTNDQIVDNEVAETIDGTKAAAAKTNEPPKTTSKSESIPNQELVPQNLKINIQEQKKQLLQQQQQTKQVTNQLKQSEKQTRKLRRNVVNLNSQLESLEHEMSAQSTELKQAAQRMERDRLRHKETLTRMQSEHSDQLELLRNQFQNDLENLKEHHRTEQADLSKKLQDAEQARAKEGGSYQEDLQQAIEREQGILQKCIFLQEEKSTLENQISSLNTQVSSLESSYKSLTITSDTAMEREREAEDKLDAALSLHAKQIGLRFSREQELERTIADLTAALVVEKQKHSNLKQQSHMQQPLPLQSPHDEMILEPSIEDILSPNEHAQTEIQDQLDMIKVQLDIEKLKTSTLQQELKDISQERTEEESRYLARQRRNERQMSDVQATMTKLQAQISHHEKEKEISQTEDHNDGIGSPEKRKQRNQQQKQITTLSEQNMKQQSRIEKCHSEILTLNNRLRQAKQRADMAEDKLKNLDLEAADPNIKLNSTVSMFGKNSNHPAKMTQYRAKKRRNRKETQSVREALRISDIPRLDTNASGEMIGNIIDALDRWSLEIGYTLRYNPLVRGGFILYLIILHVWAFCLLFFHVHIYDTLHGDYHNESGPVGVDSLIHHSYRVQEQLPRHASKDN